MISKSTVLCSDTCDDMLVCSVCKSTSLFWLVGAFQRLTVGAMAELTCEL